MPYPVTYRRPNHLQRMLRRSLYVLVTAALVLVLIFALPVASKYHRYTVTATVEDKSAASEQTGGPHLYLIYTNKGTYKVADTILGAGGPRFDSSDVWGRIQNHHTYRFLLGGYRVPLLSLYPNILKEREIR